MGGKSQKQTTKSSPWKPAQPYLKDVMSQAQDVYGSSNAMQYLPQMQQAMQPAQDVASGATSIGTGQDYQGLLDRSMAPGASEDYLTGVMNEQGINPFFQQQLDDQLARVGAQTNRAVSGAGRYGSGMHAGVLGRTLGETSTAALGNEWNRQQAQRMQAAGQLDQSQLARLGLQGSAIGGMTGVEAQNIGNQLVGGQQSLAGFGQMAALPWADISRYAGLITPMGGLGGTSSTTQSGGSPLGNILGGGLALASFL